MWFTVGRAEEIPCGQVRAFAVDGLAIPVLVAHLDDGRFAASTSMCPHEDVSLEGGDLEGCRIVCPGHHYEFDLLTGDCSHDRSLRLVRYPIVVEDGVLRVNVDLLRAAR